MEDLLSKFKGAFLGSALGDAIGKALEDVPKEESISFYGGEVRGFVEAHPSSPSINLEPHHTSDETTISVILAESIVEKGQIDPFDFFERLKRWHKREELHRYPDPTLLTAIDLISQGVGLDDAGLVSFSVEGILRCSVVGLFHYYNPYITAEGSRLVSLITHRSKEIYDASAMYGCAISYLITESFDLSKQEDKELFLETLTTFAKYEQSKRYISKVGELLKSSKSVEEAILELGNSTYVFEAFPLALFIFLRYSKDPLDAFWEAVNACGPAGGDTDAIGYMVGSMVGAYWGIEVFPQELLENLENYEYYIKLTERLYDKTMEFIERRS